MHQKQQVERCSSAKTLRIEMMRGYQRPRMFKVLRHNVSTKVNTGEIRLVSKDTEDNSDKKIPKVEHVMFAVIH
jgi:hypothetical protein